MILGLAILCLATVPIALSEKLHAQMTVDEVMEAFDRTPESVPDYQIVQFNFGRLNKRDTNSPRKLTTLAFGSDIDLVLNPAEGFLAANDIPVYTARTDAEGRVIYTESKDAMKHVGRVYEDAAKAASLVLATSSNGEQTVTGHIGSHNLFVSPVPERIARNIPTRRSRNVRSAYHIVFKREVAHPAKYGKTFEFNETNSRVPRAAPVATTPLSIPPVLYPEIMVVIDNNLFAKHSRDTTKTLRYALAFWNGVDLMYRSFDQPKFRLNVVRFVIAITDEATPYIHGGMFDDTNFIDALKAHDLAASYYYDVSTTFPIDSYDVVMTMTSLELSTDGEETDVEGIAEPRGACYVNDNHQVVYSIGMIRDDGAFTGVLTGAHEFAHLLGAKHDESRKCPSAAGYIMSPMSDITENSHDFSQCSITSIDDFLKTGKASCLYNVPKSVKPAPRILPASVVDRNQQCHIHGQGDNCFTGATDQLPCTAIYCLNPDRLKECRPTRAYAPPEGAFCGVGKICLKGLCVAH